MSEIAFQDALSELRRLFGYIDQGGGVGREEAVRFMGAIAAVIGHYPDSIPLLLSEEELVHLQELLAVVEEEPVRFRGLFGLDGDRRLAETANRYRRTLRAAQQAAFARAHG